MAWWRMVDVPMMLIEMLWCRCRGLRRRPMRPWWMLMLVLGRASWFVVRCVIPCKAWKPPTSAFHASIMQDLQSQEDILQARIQAMEYELSMRRARTERLRAMINVVQTFQASSSHRHLELDEPSIILISPNMISRSNSVCSLDGYEEDESSPPPCKKQRRR